MRGVSGVIAVRTGDSTLGPSGAFSVNTGGAITLQVGTGDYGDGDGGGVLVQAGRTNSSTGDGGSVTLLSGGAVLQDSGDVRILSAPSGQLGRSGAVLVWSPRARPRARRAT